MQRHIFDGRNRVGRDALEPGEVMTWAPPDLSGDGKLVFAEPRDPTTARSVTASATAPATLGAAISSESYDDAVLAGRQEGFVRGLEEGRKQGYEEGHQQGRREGYDEGLAAGRTDGLQQGSQQIQTQLQRLDQLLTHLTHAMNEQDYQLEQALFNLVKEVSRQVVQRELAADSRHIMQVVQEALQALPPVRDNIRIQVNPVDHALVAEAAQQSEENWRVLANGEVAPGGCRVETDHSVIDFTVGQRFAQVIEQICEQHLAAQQPEAAPSVGYVPPGEQFQDAPEPVTKPLPPASERSAAANSLAVQAAALAAADVGGTATKGRDMNRTDVNGTHAPNTVEES